MLIKMKMEVASSSKPSPEIDSLRIQPTLPTTQTNLLPRASRAVGNPINTSHNINEDEVAAPMRSDSECLSVSLAHCYEQVFCGTGLSPSLMIISHLKSRLFASNFAMVSSKSGAHFIHSKACKCEYIITIHLNHNLSKRRILMLIIRLETSLIGPSSSSPCACQSHSPIHEFSRTHSTLFGSRAWLGRPPLGCSEQTGRTGRPSDPEADPQRA